jgi:hypothetical protein
MHLRKKTPFALLLVLLAGVLVWASNSTLHVTVSEGEEEKVSLNLPVSVVSALLPVLESQMGPHLQKDHVRLGGHELDIEQLRQIWSALKVEGSYELANIQSADEKIRVTLDEENLLVQTDEDSEEQIHVRLPVSVVDELLSGNGDELNLAGALGKLASLGAADLVEVRSRDSHVRVWMD